MPRIVPSSRAGYQSDWPEVLQTFPNPSFEPTRYGKHCKAGLRYSVHCLSPALQCLPPLSSQLER
jgi:hypothetical protein